MVLILVQLVVDHLLNEDDQDADKDGERDDPDVGLQVPLLEGEILAKESIGLGEEAGRTARGRGGGGD